MSNPQETNEEEVEDILPDEVGLLYLEDILKNIKPTKLSDITKHLGKVKSGEIVGAIIKTAESGKRVVIGPGGGGGGIILFYDDAGNQGSIFLNSGGNLMLSGHNDVSLGAGNLIIPNKIMPAITDNSDIGDNSTYFRYIYANTYYGKNTSIQSFQKHDDIKLIKSIPEKKIGKRKIFSVNHIKELKHHKNDELVDIGALTGLLIGTIKQLIEKVEKLETKIKQYDTINSRLSKITRKTK